MMRKKELFDRKQKLALVSHSLLPPSAREKLKQRDDPIDDFDAYVRGEPYRRRSSASYRSTSPTRTRSSHHMSHQIYRNQHLPASLSWQSNRVTTGDEGIHFDTNSGARNGAVVDDTNSWWEELMRRKAEAEMKGYSNAIHMSGGATM
jgi:hypothetical protein